MTSIPNVANSNDEVKAALNDISPSFCLAKWYQVTIHLQNGLTHSCHHPPTHKINLEGLQENPSQLHNTEYKKEQRLLMLKGIRPKECDYCWKIEDSHQDNISDRILKSSEDWAFPYLQEAISKPVDFNFNPTYLEVSFGHSCNFKCIYCSPYISSSILGEYQKYGHYKQMPNFSLETLKKTGLYPLPEDNNPYVEAFWNWWPSLVQDLKYFRITGGEPLLNKNTFKFLEFIDGHPMPNLTFSVNSNLGIPDSQFESFLNLVSKIVASNKVKHFEFYTSIDTFGAQAEYIRDGLNYEKFISNVRKFLTVMPSNCKIILMCTFNALSVANFRNFLEDVCILKNDFRDTETRFPRLVLDMPYLRHPSFLSLAILTPDFKSLINRDLKFLKSKGSETLGSGWLFTEHEISKMERILNWFTSLKEDSIRRNLRKEFYHYINEIDKRRGRDFLSVFPELKNFFQICKDLVDNDEQSI
jgi:organic radical activating enzyme